MLLRALDYLEADFDEDGDVDGDDLSAWQSGFGIGTIKAAGDSDMDHDVDGRDFLTWQRQFGTTPLDRPAAGISQIPEPGSLVLVLTASLLCWRRRIA